MRRVVVWGASAVVDVVVTVTVGTSLLAEGAWEEALTSPKSSGLRIAVKETPGTGALRGTLLVSSATVVVGSWVGVDTELFSVTVDILVVFCLFFR